jgi:hypothetical protein
VGGLIVPVVVALISGIFVGVLVGVAIGAQGGATALVASAGIAGALVATFSSWGLSEYSTRRAVRREEVVRDKGKYGQHADELNNHVFRPCGEARLTSRLTRYPGGDPQVRGIQAVVDNSTTLVTGLPNWELGLSHMLANSTVRDAWHRASQSTEVYLRLLDKADDSTRDRFDRLARAEYGPDMHLRRTFADSDFPSWCDTPILTYLVISRLAGGMYRPFYRQRSPQEERGEPRPESPGQIFGGTGGTWVLAGRDSHDSDPAILQRIYDEIWDDPATSRLVKPAVDAEREATNRVAEFAEAIRLYSNRIATAHDFEGRCDVCRDYLLS